MKKYQAQTYSIGNVAKMTGATKKQIRNWEASGHIPKADRVQCGDRSYRRFSLKQVELIAKIRELRDEGYTLPAATEKAKSETLQSRKESRPSGIGNYCSERRSWSIHASSFTGSSITAAIFG